MNHSASHTRSMAAAAICALSLAMTACSSSDSSGSPITSPHSTGSSAPASNHVSTSHTESPSSTAPSGTGEATTSSPASSDTSSSPPRSQPAPTSSKAGNRGFEITSVVHARSAYHVQVESRPGVQGFKVASLPADGPLDVNSSTGTACTITDRLPKGMLTNYTLTCPSPELTRPGLIATSHDGGRDRTSVMSLAEGRY